MANESPHFTIEYEVWMLRKTQEQIAEWDKSKSRRQLRSVYNAVLEACLVHARALIEFFYDEPNLTAHPNTLYPDLLLPAESAWRYRKRMPKRMSKLRGLINTRLQHISVRPEKPHNWGLREIRNHIDGLVDELNRLGPVEGPIRGDRHPGRRRP